MIGGSGCIGLNLDFKFGSLLLVTNWLKAVRPKLADTQLLIEVSASEACRFLVGQPIKPSPRCLTAFARK